MTSNEYQQAALRTEKTPRFLDRGDHEAGIDEALMLSRLMHALMGVCTEGGELQDMVKKHIMYGKPFDRVNVLEECGDTLWYLALALDACGYTMSECMERNVAKLRARYPQGFTEDKALTRDLDAERLVLLAGAAPDPVVNAAEMAALGLCAKCGHSLHRGSCQ